ncbi:TraB/GumN family protein [Marinimicrobium locisalis]|uniref:TraB/GumN family protein n=1 Tax=Marinimicrobium locisalis TaxID=546022 RepID=UPI00322169B3
MSALLLLLWGLLSLVFSAGVLADNPAQSQPLLWRVQTSEHSVPVYLFGSLHFGDDSFYPLPSPVIEAYQTSDLLAVELDVSNVEPRRMRATLDRLGRYPSGVELSERIDAELWSQLTRASERLGMDAESIVHLRPWLAALQLVNLQVARSNYQAGQGIDRYFMDLAANTKPVKPLETLEQQLALFAGMTEEEQRAFLEHTLADLEATGPQLDRMAQAWREGDQADLEAVILGAFDRQDPFSQTLYERVFKTRNEAMIGAVKTYLGERQQAFVVVGIGHLIGRDGLVEGLRHSGYSVERL